MSYELLYVPKASLHEHLEGSASSSFVSKVIGENNKYDKSDFNDFLQTYDKVATALEENPALYERLISEFLKENAENNVVYTEVIISPEHMAMKEGSFDAKTYKERLEAMYYAIKEIKNHYDIEIRFIATGVRNKGIENVNKIAEIVKKHPHPLVTGFGIAGNENDGSYKQYASGFKAAQNLGLGLSLHAGELGSVDNIWQALQMEPNRIGHGIASIKSAQLVIHLAKNKVLLELCPTSNVLLAPEMESSYSNHPLGVLYDNGVRISLNADNAGLFDTSIAKEYGVAKDRFGFSRIELLDITLCAIEAAFVDKKTKRRLIEQIDSQITKEDLNGFKLNSKRAFNHILQQRLKDRAGKVYE